MYNRCVSAARRYKMYEDKYIFFNNCTTRPIISCYEMYCFIWISELFDIDGTKKYHARLFTQMIKETLMIFGSWKLFLSQTFFQTKEFQRFFAYKLYLDLNMFFEYFRLCLIFWMIMPLTMPQCKDYLEPTKYFENLFCRTQCNQAIVS